MGCGVALFDYDNDGWLDIFLVNGTASIRSARDSRPTSYLFHNNRDGTFTDVTRKAGLTHSGWGQACCVGDYDNDGFDDLFVIVLGTERPVSQQRRRHVHRRLGESGRRRVGEPLGRGLLFPRLRPRRPPRPLRCELRNFDPETAPRPGDSAYCRYNEIPVPCGPQGFAGGTNILYRNRGDGTFEDVSEKSGIAYPRGTASMVVRPRELAADRIVRNGRRRGRFRQRRLARYLRGLRHGAEPALSQ